MFSQTVADEALAAMFGAVGRARQPERDEWVQWLDERTPRELVRLDDRARSNRWAYGPLGQADQWGRIDLRHRDGLAADLASLHPSGVLRERAVGELLSTDGARSLRFLTLRSVDHVEQIRDAALRGILSRTSIEEAAICLPLLHALGARRFGVHALDEYVQAALARHGLALPVALMDSEDVPTRRAAYVLALENGGLDAELSWRRLMAEPDQVSKRLLAESFASRAVTSEVKTRLLAGSYIEGRLTAFYALDDEDFTPDEIQRGLLDPSARVRQAAQWRSRRSGDRPERFYRAQWEQRADLDASLSIVLGGLKETGQALPGDAVRGLIQHNEPRVRLAAVRLIPAGSSDADLLLGLLHDASPKVAKAAAERLGNGVQGPYDRFDDAASSPQVWTRRAAWRVRREIGTWDRIRNDLEFLADQDPGLVSLAEADLRGWIATSAATAYSVPSQDQKDAIQSALAVSGLPDDFVRVIAFHARIAAPCTRSKMVGNGSTKANQVRTHRHRSVWLPWRRT